MSARTPFVPGAFGSSTRPESRAAQTPGNAPTTSTPHFVADPSNPLNGGLSANKSQENPENRPLNIGSLTTGKGNRTQNAPVLPRRQSIQTARPPPAPNHILRPGTSDPHSKPKLSVPNYRLQAHANSHSIVAPTPLQPRSAPALFSNSPSSFPSNFKTPALPMARLSPQQPQSTDPHAFHASPTDQMTEQPASPEQYQENVTMNNSSLRIKKLPSQPGPHHMVFGAPTELVEDDDIYEVPEGEVVRNASSRNKRGRSEVEDDDEHSHIHAQTKRFKPDENPYRHSPDDNEMYHRQSSPQDDQEYPPQQPRRQSAVHPGNHQTPGGHNLSAQYSNLAQAPANSGSSSEISRLVHILKADDFDLACDARVEKYMRLAEKWKACTREEWLAGAEELAALYSKIFDFAKSHMTAKVKLFASCEEKLKEQGEVLKDRDTLLADVKDRLVAESGSVLGK